MGGRLLAIGECMVEMAATGDGLFRQGFAGDTFNAVWHARRALAVDWNVAFFTTVGDDDISARMLAFMEAGGIETRMIRRLKGRMPGLYVIELDRGERSFSYWRDASAAKALAQDETALREAAATADAILFSGITLAILPAADRTRLLDVLWDARKRGALIAFDSNIRMRLWPDAAAARETIGQASRVASLALPTGPDEIELFGGTSEDIADRYLAAGAEEVVVKFGADPARVCWQGQRVQVAPSATLVPVDTTGAGDSFNGAYLAARLSGDDPPAAARKAHAAAGRVIMAHGALV